jgi:hypothetical protein
MIATYLEGELILGRHDATETDDGMEERNEREEEHSY